MQKQKIEHFELWEQLHKAKTNKSKDKIRSVLASTYYPLVEKISYKMAEKLQWNISPEELSSLGVDGLYSAIDKFSPEKGVPFTYYASIRIQGSMVDGIRRNDMVPRSVRLNQKIFEKIESELMTIKGGSVTEEEIIEKSNFDYSDFVKNRKKYVPTFFVSMDGSDISNEQTQDNFSQDVNIALVDHKSSSPDSRLLRKEFFSKLLSKDFSRLERKIVYYYYYENLTMDVISEKLEISESRVSQIHKDLIPRLRDKIERNPEYFDVHIEEYMRGCSGSEPLF